MKKRGTIGRKAKKERAVKKIKRPKKIAVKKAVKKPIKKVVKKLVKRAAQKPLKVTAQQPPTYEMRVEEAKYYAGPSVPQPFEAEEIPQGYGDNRIVLLVRDSHWLFAYWEISDQRYQEIQSQLGKDFDRSSRVLRVYDAHSWDYFDLTITPLARDWYINVGRPNFDFCVDLGFKTPDGRFVAAARSNVVHTPRAGLSDIIDEEWMIPDWEKLYGLCGGFGIGHSLELREMVKRRLEEKISSPGMTKRA